MVGYLCQWIGLRENLQEPWFLPSHIGFSGPVNFPIIQFHDYANGALVQLQGWFSIHKKILRSTQSTRRGIIITPLPKNHLIYLYILVYIYILYIIYI